MMDKLIESATIRMTVGQKQQLVLLAAEKTQETRRMVTVSDVIREVLTEHLKDRENVLHEKEKNA